MKKPTSLVAAAVLVFCFAMLSSVALVQSSADFGLWWHLIAGGGGRSTSSGYGVSGSIGQPLVGTSGGASYGLRAGFWPGLGVGAPPTPTPTTTPPGAHRLYLPVLVKGH